MKAIGSYPTIVQSFHLLDPGQRYTLITLYTLANDELVVWDTAQAIADLTGYALRAVHVHLKRLLGCGQIRPVKRKDPRRNNAHFFGLEMRMNLNGEDRWTPDSAVDPVVGTP